MAFQQNELNTSWLPALSAAQAEHDMNQTAEVTMDEENPSPETPKLTPALAEEEDFAHFSRQPSLPPSGSFDMIEETRKLNASAVPLVADPGGDTWIFIDPPARQHNQDPYHYQAICEHFTLPHCIRSQTLRNLNSSVFVDWLHPTLQYRIQRRRRLVERLPAHIKYVIDLTPQVEGDEGAHLLSELMCPDGVRTWTLASCRWKIPLYLVGGTEEYSCLDTRTQTKSGDQTELLASARAQLYSTGGRLEPDEIRLTRQAAYDALGNVNDRTLGEQEYVIPACYTEIRHHCAIERVLNILVDNDPRLDSAPKVWTTFVMAKHMGVANHVNLNNYIIRWLQANHNMAFLDVMPELCLAMADGLQNYNLCRDAFGLLVGERALESLQSEPTGLNGGKTKNFPVTIHGRKKYDISEAYETRLEYAYIGFREMALREYATLVEGDWIEDLPEFRRMSDFAYSDEAYQIRLGELRRLLLDYVRGSIMFALRARPELVPGPYGDRTGNDDIFPTTAYATIWKSLALQQRVLTRAFWILLCDQKLEKSKSNNQMWNRSFGEGQTSSYTYHTRELDGESTVVGATTSKMVKRAIEDCKLKLVGAGIIEAWKSCGREEEVASDAEDLVEDNTATEAGWSATNQDRWLWEDEQQTSREQPPFPNFSSRKVLSDKPAAKRPKIEHGAGNEAQAYVEGTKDLPLRLYEQSLNSPREQDSRLNHALPSVAGLSALLNERARAECNQKLDPSPYDANASFSALPKTTWTEQVDIENAATLGAACQYEQDSEGIGNRFESARRWWRDGFKFPFIGHGSYTDHKGLPEDHPENLYIEYEKRFFDLKTFFLQANSHIHGVCKRMLGIPRNANACDIDFSLSNVLTCLTDNEWKYLPLWAGGNDDGTGGVFDDEIPIPDAQFTTAGPKVFSSGNSSAASSSSEFDMVSGVQSTRNTSTVVQDGFSDTLDRHRTYAASEVSDSPSTVGRLASQLGEYDMLSDVTAEEHPSHVEEHPVSQKGHKIAEAGPDADADPGTKLSAVAMGKARANPDDSYDDVFNYSDLEEEDFEGEGEDQVFEDD